MVKIITTESYFNLFPLLKSELKNPNDIGGTPNAIFSEEKISLLLERTIADNFNGSFNTDVFSFSNFLKKNIKLDKTLSKEGSSMVIRRILSNKALKCFKAKNTELSSTLYNLIIQLKSAKVEVEDIKNACNNIDGILKNKLEDIATIYEEYENYIKSNGFNDQSSILSYLPDVIENSKYLRGANVYLVGFIDGFTKQIRLAIKSLLKVAGNITLIAVNGSNLSCYVNETAQSFKNICSDLGVSYREQHFEGDFCQEGRELSRALFNPCYTYKKIETDKIKMLTANSNREEIMRVGEVIKEKVIKGYRYKDFSIAVNDLDGYSDAIREVFNQLEIPVFLNSKRVLDSHPLITLINSYCESFRKGLERNTLSTFFKNPLYCDNKDFADTFDNYLLLCNGYSAIKKPFTIKVDSEEEFNKLENERQRLCSIFTKFNVRAMLNSLNVKEKLQQYSKELKEKGEKESASLCDQVYDSVESILTQMEQLLDIENITPLEFKNVFTSGVSALLISVIPQYNDAVFVGDFSETAMVKSKCLFVVGLSEDIPKLKEDVALLSDSDINKLENISVLVEPKIKIVNKREKEHTALGMCSFSEELYLSYSNTDNNGKNKLKSQILNSAEKLFTLKEFPQFNGYLTEKEGLSTFSKECGAFLNGDNIDFTNASSFYSVANKEKADFILEQSNKEIKLRLPNGNPLFCGTTSPTLIEDYFTCPYKVFLDKGIRLKERESGEIDGRYIGILMHEVFNQYMQRIDEAHDIESSNKIVEEIKAKLLSEDKYKKFSLSGQGEYNIESAFTECKKFCYNMYRLLTYSKFKVEKGHTEVKFGDGEKFPAISLCNGKIKLTGTIDRIDTYKDYCRIIDYKTGRASAETKKLYCGEKLQLYLYGSAVKGYKIAGVYYVPVADDFKTPPKEKTFIAMGKTLNDDEIIDAQDSRIFSEKDSEFVPVKFSKDKISGVVDQKVIDSCVEYATRLSEEAGKQMLEGIIVPSPLLDTTCEYCKYKAVCGVKEENIRKEENANDNTICEAVAEEE